MIVFILRVKDGSPQAKKNAEKAQAAMKAELGERACVVVVPAGVDLTIAEPGFATDVYDEDEDDESELWKQGRHPD